MKIRKKAWLSEMYAHPGRAIRADSPELRFITTVCGGMAEEAVSLFREKGFPAGVGRKPQS